MVHHLFSLCFPLEVPAHKSGVRKVPDTARPKSRNDPGKFPCDRSEVQDRKEGSVSSPSHHAPPLCSRCWTLAGTHAQHPPSVTANPSAHPPYLDPSLPHDPSFAATQQCIHHTHVSTSPPRLQRPLPRRPPTPTTDARSGLAAELGIHDLAREETSSTPCPCPTQRCVQSASRPSTVPCNLAWLH